MKIEKLHTIFLKSKKVSTDTRKISPDSIFFALKGENFDGNKFASAAIDQGASFAVVDNPEVVVDERYILVPDTLKTLQQLATYHRQKLNLPIIAITGTNGKTTTKELTAGILSQKYNTSFTQGNLNNHIGVPLTLLAMDHETELGVVEMGANHIGEIKELCDIALPNYGLITNIGKAHLEGFGSIEGIKQTKSELYRFLESTNGKIFINTSNTILTKLAGKQLESISYGNSDSEVYGSIGNSEPFLEIQTNIKEEELLISTKLIGNYNLENVLAAISIGNYFQVDSMKVKAALEKYLPGNNRSQFIEKGSNKIIMDAYNANPSSMQTSITNFLSLNHPRKIVILGDMLELGSDSLNEHQKVIELFKNQTLDNIFLVGQNFNHVKNITHEISFLKTADLIEYLKTYPIQNSLCLIKGSRGIKLEEVLKVL